MMMIAFRHAKKEWEKKKRGMYVAKIKPKERNMWNHCIGWRVEREPPD